MLCICQHISRNILIYFQYFYCVGIFLHFLIFFDIFSVFFRKEKGKGRAAAKGSVTSHAIRKDSLWESLRMTAVAVTSQKKNRFG